MVTKEEIIKKNIPNGIVNIKAKGKGNGKPQYQAEIDIIKICMDEYAASELGKGWKPYPENEPKKDGRYLVCFADGKINIDAWQGDEHYEPHWVWFSKWDYTKDAVIAFMELPESYKIPKHRDHPY